MPTVQDLQTIENAYLVWLTNQLTDLPVVGTWNWPAYDITTVSGVVVGFRQLAGGSGNYEIVYSVTLTSSNVIPHAQQGMQEVADSGASSFSFVQLGDSVPVSGGNYQTKILSTYTGPMPTAPPAGGATPADGPLDPPHPPP
jgi:hypothetical protein